MTNTPKDQPLWWVMEAAWESTPEVPMNQEGHCYAAMLRAIADRVAPEVAPAAWQPVCKLYERHERQRIRALLLAEADRALEGER